MTHDPTFDVKLAAAQVRERELYRVFTEDGIRSLRFELKSESWQWERTNNICIETHQHGRRSGISLTTADHWVHELYRDGVVLCRLMFPTHRLEWLMRMEGTVTEDGGGSKAVRNVIIPISRILV